jgi:hypothetical protein
VTARFTLPDDGIIDLIAVEIAASGNRPVALTPPERQLAAARILARGGTPALVSKRLHVNGTTALTLAARYRHNQAAARGEHHHRQAGGIRRSPQAGTCQRRRPAGPLLPITALVLDWPPR